MAAHVYRITVEGELGDQMESAFPGLTLTRDHGTSSLTGEVADQAALQAVLRRLTDFGLTLLETKVIPDTPESAPDPGDRAATPTTDVR